MKSLFASLALFITSFLFAGTIKTKTYVPDKNAIFNVASTIIYGEKDAYLIDAQFQTKYAEELVKEIKTLKKDLKLIYISHSDPDFYFGLDILKKNFPNAKIVSTAQTAYLIKASKDGKLATWGPQLKNDAPSQIIIPSAINSIPDLEGHKIEITLQKDDPAHSFIWIPSIKTILGGISVSEESHIWMADTQDEYAIDKWITQINNMKALNPSVVIPSHFSNENFSPKILDFTKQYLISFKKAATTLKGSDEIVKSIKKEYPNLSGTDNLEFGTKVFTGEAEWDFKNPYPTIGHEVTLVFDNTKYNLAFIDDKRLSDLKDKGNEIHYESVEVAKNVFMVYWNNEKTGENITQIQNFNNNKVYSNHYSKDGKVSFLEGQIKIN